MDNHRQSDGYVSWLRTQYSDANQNKNHTNHFISDFFLAGLTECLGRIRYNYNCTLSAYITKKSLSQVLFSVCWKKYVITSVRLCHVTTIR